ncbi:acyltransferase family protein [Pelagibacterium mangrovi]|uniref:acyltransferase family protein n=1 Tax=Pelagibacterium mangrovi TaxID=3119828 RepID=UPI002FCAABD4
MDLADDHYRPEIDGLRGFAVAAIMLANAKVGDFSGGLIGFDVFFVISGFLVTQSILRNAGSGRFSFVNFYARRARRTMPMVWATVIGVVYLAFFVPGTEPFEQLLESAAGTALLYNNFLLATTVGDGMPALYAPLAHTWAIAAAAQIYLVLPFIIVFALARWPDRIVYVLGGMMLASLALAVLSPPTPQNLFLPQFRAWEILAGSMCALLAPNMRPNTWFAAIGCLLVALSVLLIGRLPSPFLSLVPAVAGTGIILIFTCKDEWVGRALSTRPLAIVGTISLSVFLIHQPAYELARLAWGGSASVDQIAVISLMVFFTSFATWRIIERPLQPPDHIAAPEDEDDEA